MTRSYAAGTQIAPDAALDLQTHTLLSDGTWQPVDLIDHFMREGFAVAAITDHDRVDTMAETQQIARERDFPLLVATEMTTRWRDSLVDILCFGFEVNPQPLQVLCEAVRQDQIATSRTMVGYLVQHGFIPQLDELRLNAILNAPSSNQLNLVLDWFVEHNGADDYQPLIDAGYRLCTSPTADVVAAAHQAAAVALIAHPGRTDGFATFDAALLDDFRAEIPIDGLEVYYPMHTDEQIALYENYAYHQGWLLSAGSDSHKPDKPPIQYRADKCAALLARLDFVVE